MHGLCRGELHAVVGSKRKGVGVYGISAQVPEMQKEASTRLGLSYPLLSDFEYSFSTALKLPLFEVDELLVDLDDDPPRLGNPVFGNSGKAVESVPLFVLGGAGIVMFGMVAATGIRILTAVDFKTNRNNLYIVAIAIGFGMIPLVAPTFFSKMPKELGPLLHSGILLSAFAAVALNLFFNGWKGGAAAEQEIREAAAKADAH